jgi:arylsulfatase A-like enzyme
MGKLDNTLIIYIAGDNGPSPEGTLLGTPNQYTSYNGILKILVEEQLKFYDAWGSAATYPLMAVAWSWAFDTPFKWTKQVASHFGGTRQGLAISWPAHIKDAGGIRTQFHHVIDIAPTILEAAGIKAPEMVDGIKQNPIEGVSIAYTFDKAKATAPSSRTTQYFELMSNRGIYQYQSATCPQLRAQKGQPKSMKEQEAIRFLHNDAQARVAFLDKIARPVANKLFECGMISVTREII